MKDHTGHIRTFDLDKMIEITHGNNPNTSPIFLKIERRDFKSTKQKIFSPFLIIPFSIGRQSVQLPSHWTPMTKPWDRIFLGRRDNTTEWSLLF